MVKSLVKKRIVFGVVSIDDEEVMVLNIVLEDVADIMMVIMH